MGSPCPPETASQPSRNSFTMFVENVCVSPAARLTECVLRVRPKPGRSASFNTLEPNGSNSWASKTDARMYALSLSENLRSSRGCTDSCRSSVLQPREDCWLFPDEVGCGNLASKARAVAVAGLLIWKLGSLFRLLPAMGCFVIGIDELLGGDGDKA